MIKTEADVKKFALSLMAMLVLGCVGCQQHHKVAKQEAVARWQDARAKMATDMAQQQFEAGNLEAAARTVSSALEITPDYLPARLLSAQIELERGRLTLARQILMQCLQVAPDNAHAHHSLGIIHERWSQLDQALDHYRQAHQAQPENVAHLSALTQTMVAVGQEDRALTLLQDQLHRGGPDRSLLVLAGQIQTRQGRHAEALHSFEQARNLGGFDATIEEAVAFSLLAQQKPRQALLVFEQLYEHAEAGAAMRYLLWQGQCHMQLQQYHRSARCFEQVTAAEPENAMAWLRLAQARLARNDDQAAWVAAEKAVELDPDQSEALAALSYAALKTGYHRQAEDALSRLLLRDPDNVMAHCLMGRTLIEQGRLHDAQRQLQEARAIDARDPLVRQFETQLAAVSH